MFQTPSPSAVPSKAKGGNTLAQLKQAITQVSWGIIPPVALLIALNRVSQGVSISPELVLMIISGTLGLLLSLQQRFLDISLSLLLLMLCGAALFIPRLDGFILLTIISLPVAALFAGNMVYGIVLLVFLIKAFLIDMVPGLFWSIPADDTLLLTTITLFVGLLSLLSLLVRLYEYHTSKLIDNAAYSMALLDVSQNMGNILSRYLDEGALLQNSLELLATSFQCNELAVYRVDNTDNSLELLRAYPEHRHVAENPDIVERCLLADEVLLYRNPLISSYDLALPLKYGTLTIGVLHLQRRMTAFSNIELGTLQLVGIQLAIALRNTQLYEAQRQTNNENKRLFMESRTSLREIDQLKRQLTREAWSEYLQTEQRVISGVTLDKQGFRPEDRWTADMEKARIRRHSITEQHDHTHIITMPIELRKEVIGAIEVEVDTSIREDEIRDMLTSIAGRLAVSLDNARLFEETQQVTIQEQQASDLVARYQIAGSVEDLLKITLEDLSSSLGAESAQIRLGKIPEIAMSATESGRLDNISELASLVYSQQTVAHHVSNETDEVDS
ncbi:MAG: hypothetical protein ACPG7F_06435 [Aggregatilineales bacterium]